MKSREIHLAARPVGMPTRGDFQLVEVELPEPADGEVLVDNIYMSVDPYMRGRMNAARSYAPPYEIGKVLYGGAVGRVVTSRSSDVSEGDIVVSNLGWRERFMATPAALQRVEPGELPVSLYLGVLGLTGFTAWYGLKEIGRPRAGETVFVSAAAGAVGSVAGQLGKAWGCRAVGSAGSDAKVALLIDEMGFDAAFDYRKVSLADGLRQAAPEGIDVYFDNVGGAHLEAAIAHMHDFGRIVACGSISQYNLTSPAPGPANLGLVVSRRLRLQGFIVSDHNDRLNEFRSEMTALVKEGKLQWRETIREGIESGPQALIDLLSGENVGKMLVRLSSAP